MMNITDRHHERDQLHRGNTMKFWKLLPAAALAAGIVVAAPVAASAAAVGPTASGSATAFPEPYVNHINAYKISSSVLIDNTGGRQASGNAIQMWSHGSVNNETWFVSWGSSVLFRIRLAANPNYCLDLTAGSLKSGTKIQLWKCSATFDANQWWWINNGSGGPYVGAIFPDKTLTSGHGPGQKPGSVALDAGTGKNGVRLEIKTYSGGKSQQFKFPNVSP
jgi:hypothetical protein